MKIRNIVVSTNNSKLGIIPNISLLPIRTCINKPPCAKSCYARRLIKRYKNSKNAYELNLNTLLSNSGEFFDSLHAYFNCFKPSYFRIHSSGDFCISQDDSICQDYVNLWGLFARQYPNTKFLAFTKCYHLNFSAMPDNMSVIFSAWFNYPLPDMLPSGVKGIAYVQDANQSETRIPDNAVKCSGQCDSCFKCWNLNNQSVVFNLH